MSLLTCTLQEGLSYLKNGGGKQHFTQTKRSRGHD